MVKKISSSNVEIVPTVLELKTEIVRLKKALCRLETSVGVLQAGDKKGPYWNGNNAYYFYKSCLGQLDHDYTLLKEIIRCYEYLDKKVTK